MIFGYARISTNKDTQKTDRQIDTLKNYSKSNDFKFDDIIEEKISGRVKVDNRPLYKNLKAKLRSNDILVLSDLDRLGRNADDIITELKDLKSKGIKVVVLDIPYMNEWNKVQDNSLYEMIVDILITLKAHMAQQEREKIQQRINQGLQSARAKGKKLGRPEAELPREFIKHYEKYLNKSYGTISATELSKIIGIGRSTYYKYVKVYKMNFK